MISRAIVTALTFLALIPALTGCGSNSNAEELSPTLSQILIGTWHTQSFNQRSTSPYSETTSEFTGQTGTLSIYSDLEGMTAEVDEGTVGIFDECSSDGCDESIFSIDIINEQIIRATSPYSGELHTYITPVNIGENSMTLLFDDIVVTMNRI